MIYLYSYMYNSISESELIEFKNKNNAFEKT